MNDKSKSKASEFNTIKNSANISENPIKQDERKNEGCNDWNSVPRTYDKEESLHKHEKTATNNQWCSTSK